MLKQRLLQIVRGCKSWEDIHQKIKSINNDDHLLAGNLFQYFCQAYYLTESNSLHKDVWLFDDIPLDIKKKLRFKPKLEKGVDLVIRSTEGTFSAVQCKFKNDQRKKLLWGKPDKLSHLFADGRFCDDYIVFANTSAIDPYCEFKFHDRLTFVSFYELDSITEQRISKILSFLESGSIPPSIKTPPYEFQLNAIAKVVEGFNKDNKGKLIMPCGSGKTYTSLWIKEALKSKRTLVLVPSLSLLKQFKDDWAEEQSYPIEYLCVCSAKDIDTRKDQIKFEGYQLNAPNRVTLDKNRIIKFLSSSGEQLIYSTYQSLPKVAEAQKKVGLPFDLVIADEAHRTAIKRTSNFALIHDHKKIKANKRLYMTATEKILSNQAKSHLSEEQLKIIADMSKKSIYGINFFEMNFGEAIAEKVLCDYKIIGMGVRHDELKRAIDTRKYIKDGITIDELINNYALNKVMERYGLTHAVTFHSRINWAKQFKNRHSEIFGKYQAYHVNGGQSTNERAEIFRAYKNNPKAIITNAQCLTEGVNIPIIDCVYFCDPKESLIDIVQSSGRALRKPKNVKKDYGYIVVPIFHKNRKNIESAIDKSVFKNLVSIVRSMANQDKRLQEEINRIVFEKGLRKNKKGKKVIDVVDSEFIELVGFEDELMRTSLFDQVIEKNVDSWMVSFEMLKLFRQENPDRWPLAKEKYKETGLGVWCDDQRTKNKEKHKNTKLTEEQFALLDSAGFPWAPREDQWPDKFELYKKFKRNNPNKEPTRKEQKELFEWANNQRTKYQNKTILDLRIELLNGENFVWDRKEAEWEEGFSELLVYLANNPNNFPTTDYTTPSGYKLGSWIRVNRRNKKTMGDEGKKGLLTKEKIKRLNENGFLWDKYDADWLKHYQKLLTFRQENPNRWPTRGKKNDKDSDEVMMANWCTTQRVWKKNGKLKNKDRIKLLEDMKFPF